MDKQYTIFEMIRMTRQELIEIIKDGQFRQRDLEKTIKDIKLMCNVIL